MDLTWTEVEAALARVHRIEPSKLGAFRSRLRHLQADGFPPGIQVGKGRRASYSFGHVMQMVLAVELMQAGTGPTRIKALVTGSWPYIRTNIMEMLKDRSVSSAWSIRPQALADMSVQPGEGFVEGFEVVDKEEVGGLLSRGGFVPANDVTWRLLAIDGRQVLDRLFTQLKAVVGDVDLAVCCRDLEAENGDDQEEAVDQPERGAAGGVAGQLHRRQREAAD